MQKLYLGVWCMCKEHSSPYTLLELQLFTGAMYLVNISNTKGLIFCPVMLMQTYELI